MTERINTVRKSFTLTLLLCLAVVALRAESKATETVRENELVSGLVVQIGIGELALPSDKFFFCGLDTDEKKVTTARKDIKSKNLYGRMNAILFNGKTLPFAKNMVNRITAKTLGDVPMEEVLRVLVPNGSAIINGKKTVKPWPAGMDEWNHYLRDVNNNAVSQDEEAGHPRSMQWADYPKFSRMHESLRRTTSMVTDNGRLFSIIDEGNDQDISLPPSWVLQCRDAFNGIVLWKREITNWANYLRSFRSGPSDLTYRLVAANNRVFVTLGLDQPLTILDAATGKTLKAVEGSTHAAQILVSGDDLLIMTDPYIYHGIGKGLNLRRGVKEGKSSPQTFILADANSGEVKWVKEFKDHVHTTVTRVEDKIIYQTKSYVACMDVDKGNQIWKTELDFAAKNREGGGHEIYTMVGHKEVVLAASGNKISSLSLADGKVLWEKSIRGGYNSAPDVLVINGLVRVGNDLLDPITGISKKLLEAKGADAFPSLSHHRCYRIKATEKYILQSRSGVELISTDNGEVWQNHWIRGECQYGIMPANGLLYIPSDPCACNMQIKLNGYWAFSPRNPKKFDEKIERLVKGEAYGKTVSETKAPWPTYRSNNLRSGSSDQEPGKNLTSKWQLKLNKKLSAITLSDSHLYFSAIDEHDVYAVGRETGKVSWTFTAGARVDSPPTLYKGLAIFGSADGWVYALRAEDGALVWKFMAAPENRRIMSFGQLESVWPVPGSVLVNDGTLIVAAGRQTYIDGGIFTYHLDPLTGAVKSQAALNSLNPSTGKQFKPIRGGVNLQGTKNDVLSANGDDVFMRHMKVDFTSQDFGKSGVHLFTEVGFLDDTQWYRCYWLYADKFSSGWSSWINGGSTRPSGRIIAYNDDFICGYGRDKYPPQNNGQWAGEKYQLYAMNINDFTAVAKETSNPNSKNSKKKKRKKRKRGPTITLKYIWTKDIPMMARAMTIANGKLIIAGLPDPHMIREDRRLESKEKEAELSDIYNNKQGGLIAIYDVKTGELLKETKLDSAPVFDGMALSDGKIYITLKNGTVQALD